MNLMHHQVFSVLKQESDNGSLKIYVKTMTKDTFLTPEASIIKNWYWHVVENKEFKKQCVGTTPNGKICNKTTEDKILLHLIQAILHKMD